MPFTKSLLGCCHCGFLLSTFDFSFPVRLRLHVSDHIQLAITAQLAAARQSRQRRMLVLAGEPDWGRAIVSELYSVHGFKQSLCVSDAALPPIATLSNQQARQLLGQELDLLIYDCWAGLHPDALPAVSGSLVGGGLLVLLLPPLPQWPRFNDPDYQRLLVHPYQSQQVAGRFIEHIRRSVLHAEHSLLIEQSQPPQSIAAPVAEELGNGAPVTVASVASEQGQIKPGADGCITVEQSQAVAAIKSVLCGHRRRPLVITADRGRGKSAALGIASAQLMQQRSCQIVITAPRMPSVAIAFEHAAKLLQLPLGKLMQLQWQQSSLSFVAPDTLLQHSQSIDLLLIDEAAAIPASLLEQLLKRYPRLVFATTVHGYEGTGRGFELRFKQILQQHSPQWKALHLRQPVRWAEQDPVEQWLFDALLLNASPVDGERLAELCVSQCLTEKLDRDQLLADSETLRELFGLLVLAHYQTSPSDLRILLDGLNISVWVTRYQGHVVAAALVADEGGFDAALSREVWKNKRRPQGHLLPQTLSAHGGFEQATTLAYQRIVRIAVHPAVQRQSVGRQLMAAIVEQARVEQYDFVGCSFAATADVLAFWQQLNFSAVMLGVSRDASSGCHSLLLLSALSAAGGELLSAAKQRFNQQFPRDLMVIYPQLELELVAGLLLDINQQQYYRLSQQQWLDTEAFAEGFRQYEQCFLSLWTLVCQYASSHDLSLALSPVQCALLIRRLLQNQPIKTVTDATGLAGKKQLQLELRNTIAIIRRALINELKPHA
jgi:tRNA(Met) cytidine acetyltransferase